MDTNELSELHATIGRLREAIAATPEWCESTPLGELASMDDDALALAARVVFRFYLNSKFPTVPAASYFPANPLSVA